MIGGNSNGNLLTDTFHTYTWNQDNHPKAMTDAGITMIYDAFGRMVEKATGSTYRQTLLSPAGPVALMSKQIPVQIRMPLPGGDIAVSGLNFYHTDHLGSVPLVSSRFNRTSIAARLFAPYGESYHNVGITGDVNFTGDNQDLVAGTFDTPNRELNPTQGRWISPDPGHAGWNAYAYTTNPLGEIDPSGLNATEYIPCGCGSFGNGDGVFISDGGGLGSDAWGTVGGGLSGYFNTTTAGPSYGVGAGPSINEQEQESLGMVSGDSNWTPMFSTRGGQTLGTDNGVDGQQQGTSTAPANSRTDVFLYGTGDGKPKILNLIEWEMHWLAGTCSGTTCHHDNNQLVTGVEIDGNKPLGAIGTNPKMGEASDFISLEPRTIFQWWSINGKQVQVVLGIQGGHLVTTWGVQIVVQGGIVNPPIYSSAPGNSPPQ